MYNVIGIPPRQITTFIASTTTEVFTGQDIRNIIKDNKRIDQRGHAPNSALIEDLKNRGTYYKVTLDEESRITALFIACDESLQLARTNQDIVLLDCTYKTNKFDMPLFHIVGMFVIIMCAYFLNLSLA